ncbi:hypothetical protein BDV93DRAFT_548284 [Ceratobasidium sp. AG-I]|nr:hypothetical protein BDV93DRAFT_548284 [Ceratobasidium sp. AG-I]
MSGEVQVPLPPPAALAPTTSSGASLSSSPTTRKSSTHPAAKSPVPSDPEPVADVNLELKVDRISSTMGARLVVAFVELAMYLKGQVPLPASQLRRMVAGGRKGSPYQNKFLKSAHALADDLPSTLVTLGSQRSVTLAIVFGLGRAKCFIQLSGADFTQHTHVEGKRTSEELPIEETADMDRPSASSTLFDENSDVKSSPLKCRPSLRQPLREITPLDSLTSQLASFSLKPSVEEGTIRQAERMLSQAMACSDVEFSGNLSPMGAQVFLRAPRTFKHGSWGVRNDAGRMLDGPYDALVSGQGSLVECVRIRAHCPVVSEADDAEEMIWWGWDGRLAGYA